MGINEILLVAAAFVAGGLLAFLFVKNSQSKKYISLEKSNGILSARVEALNGNILKLEQKETQLEGQIAGKQNEIEKAIQEKTEAETSLKEAGKTIAGLQQREADVIEERNEIQRQKTATQEKNAELQAKYDETITRLREQEEFINDAQNKLKEAFGSLSAVALKNNNESFVQLAKTKLDEKLAETKGEMEKKEQAIDALVKPLSESLGKFDNKIQELEKLRLEQHGQVSQFIMGVQQTTEKLQKETHNLVSALKTSHVRGRYGEIALRRVVEFAGMTEHCDFSEQTSVATDDGTLRPDMNILLPENKMIVVDAKTPLAAYMRAFETEDEEERKACMMQHAIAVKDHLKKLSAKAYWSQFSDSPDYVILYMQIESSFGAALQFDPSLIEEGIMNKVVFATPTTLITLLRTVGFVWQQRSVADNIEEIRDAGVELYNRTNTLLKHFSGIGGSLKIAVGHYNNAVASLESRFIPQANKLYSLGSAYIKNEIGDFTQIEVAPRIVESNDDDLTEEEKITAVLKPEQ